MNEVYLYDPDDVLTNVNKGGGDALNFVLNCRYII